MNDNETPVAKASRLDEVPNVEVFVTLPMPVWIVVSAILEHQVTWAEKPKTASHEQLKEYTELAQAAITIAVKEGWEKEWKQ